MIGSALAIRYIAKKPWMIALAFWAVYFIIGLIFVTKLLTSISSGWWLGIVISFLIFMALTTFWLKLHTMIAVICFAVAYVLDYVIMLALASMGISLSSLFGGLL